MLLFISFLANNSFAQDQQEESRGFLIEPIKAEIRTRADMLQLDQQYKANVRESLRFIILAQFAYFERDFNKALTQIDESLKLFETTEGYALKGTLQYLTGKKVEAQKSWEKAGNLSPEFFAPDLDVLDQIIRRDSQN